MLPSTTTLSTLLPVAALYFFGGATLRDFAFALLVGIAAGSYSSIFVAAPLLAWSYLGWVMHGRLDYHHGMLNWLHWLPSAWPYSADSGYHSGPLLFFKRQFSADGTSYLDASFLVRMPVVVGPMLLAHWVLRRNGGLRGWTLGEWLPATAGK